VTFLHGIHHGGVDVRLIVSALFVAALAQPVLGQERVTQQIAVPRPPQIALTPRAVEGRPPCVPRAPVALGSLIEDWPRKAVSEQRVGGAARP
jgi:hypothetical protein